MPPPKLHLNEHPSPHLAEQLRKYGFDVTSALELSMVEADDDEQLAYAVSDQRAIVTFNRNDFAVRRDRYLAEGKEHWDIVLSTEETIDILRRRLLRLLNTVSVEELKNQICWLNEFK